MDANGARASRDEERAEAVRRIRRGVHLTVPVVLAGAMTVTMNLTGALPAADAAPKKPEAKPRALVRSTPVAAPGAASTPAALAPAQAAPSRYVVASGDTVSRIAARFGLRTADVLARNGLGWSSLIYPGQVLVLGGGSAAPVAAPPASSPARGYTIQRGDTISGIAGRLGVTTQAILDANGLSRTSIIYPGQSLRIPAGPASTGDALDIQTVSSVTPVAPADWPTTPVVNSPAPVVDDAYTVRAGDTLSGIAGRFGISASAIMRANGLGATSLIYPGSRLVLPGVTAVQDGTTVTPLTPEMAANARIVIQVGRQLGVPDRGIVIALATAMQESSLRNLGHGDRDSVGLFQQRPSTGWGTASQLTDVSYAARLFYGGPKNPNAGRTKGLLDIPGWSGLSLTQAAQWVQISAYPNAYAKWEKSAQAWLAQLR